MIVTLSDERANEMGELTSTTAAEAAQIAAGEGSALGDDVWLRDSPPGTLSEAAWSALDSNEPVLHCGILAEP